MSDERLAPIGRIMVTLAGAKLPTVPRPDHCGGASLFLSRKEALERSTLHFDADPRQVLPETGRGSIRLRCNGSVSRKGGTYAALCSTCLERERENRDYLAGKAQEAAVASKPASRRFPELVK